MSFDDYEKILKFAASRHLTIVAVDFDGTLNEDIGFPRIGPPKWKTIEYCLDAKKKGWKLILWTCRSDGNLEEAIDWCKDHGLEFDAINDNLKELTEEFGNNSRKVFANYYLDDKALNVNDL